MGHGFTFAGLTVAPAARQARLQPLPDPLTPPEMSPGGEGAGPGASPVLRSPRCRLRRQPRAPPRPVPARPALRGARGSSTSAAERGEGRRAQPKPGARWTPAAAGRLPEDKMPALGIGSAWENRFFPSSPSLPLARDSLEPQQRRPRARRDLPRRGTVPSVAALPPCSIGQARRKTQHTTPGSRPAPQKRCARARPGDTRG